MAYVDLRRKWTMRGQENEDEVHTSAPSISTLADVVWTNKKTRKKQHSPLHQTHFCHHLPPGPQTRLPWPDAGIRRSVSTWRGPLQECHQAPTTWGRCHRRSTARSQRNLWNGLTDEANTIPCAHTHLLISCKTNNNENTPKYKTKQNLFAVVNKRCSSYQLYVFNCFLLKIKLAAKVKNNITCINQNIHNYRSFSVHPQPSFSLVFEWKGQTFATNCWKNESCNFLHSVKFQNVK